MLRLEGIWISNLGGDVQPAHTAGPRSILDVFAELDLLRTQATNIQAQLDGQREVSTGFAWSITNIQHELQTLCDAYQSNSKMIDIAITTADESHAHMLEYKSAASNLTYQFHTVSSIICCSHGDLLTLILQPRRHY